MSETNRIEYKAQLTKDLDLEKEVVAFLNYPEGGLVYIGIDKDGNTIGVQDSDNDMLKINDRIEITSAGSLPDSLSESEFFEGFSVPRNKELMRIYKDLDLVEQLGSGIPRILETYGRECFHFSANFLRMVFPSLVAVHTNEQVTEQATEQVTEQVARLISVIEAGRAYSGAEIMNLVGLKHRPTFLYNYLQPAIDAGLIQPTKPEKPTSSKQKYRLTE